MIILIAESKTMVSRLREVSAEEFNAHCPQFELRAEEIMSSLSRRNEGELAEAVGVSQAMALKLRGLASDFAEKSAGMDAMRAYTGVVFRAASYETMTSEAREATRQSVRIISSLYGWLRPDDIVRPYRLEFKAAVGPGGETLAAYWRRSVTDALIAELENMGEDTIIDLLPADASRCIDWARVGARVIKADFAEMGAGGATRTPHSNRLKTLRGLLLRQLVTDNVTPAKLATIESADYCAESLSPTRLLLHTAST